MALRFSRFLRLTKYSKTHEWVRPLPDRPQTYRVGISKFAQEQLGEVVFVELPKLNAAFSRNAVFATLESVKAVGEVFCPLNDAKVVAVNAALKDKPNLVNTDPEGDGWIAEFSATEIPGDLVDAEIYSQNIGHLTCSVCTWPTAYSTPAYVTPMPTPPPTPAALGQRHHQRHHQPDPPPLPPASHVYPAC